MRGVVAKRLRKEAKENSFPTGYRLKLNRNRSPSIICVGYRERYKMLKRAHKDKA